MINAFRGVGISLVTPFHRHGTVDFTTLGQIINTNIEAGINFLVALEGTGEPASLSDNEYVAVTEFVKEINGGRVPLVLGIQSTSTQGIVNKIKTLDLNGIQAIIPNVYYPYKPRQKGIFQHYRTILGASPLPVLIYNCIGNNNTSLLSVETVLQLNTEFKNFIGVFDVS